MVQELPPDVRPESDDATWIPGYWAWDDEVKQFLWVSGVWRIPPPGRRWVPGEWVETEDGFRWVSGFWAAGDAAELQYLPEPPASLELGPSTAPPSDEAYWVQGSWVYQDPGYAWQAGYWAGHRDGWVWVAANYSWTPRGCIYVPGYWDYSPLSRGLLFAPVYFNDPYLLGANYSYRPWIACSTSRLLLHLFTYPGRRHYYWGDYYGASYLGLGYRPWYRSYSRRAFSPSYDYYRRHYARRGIDYHQRLHGWHGYFEQHAAARPPRTYRDARRLDGRSPELRQAVVSVSLRDQRQVRDVVRQQHLGSLRSLDERQREQFTRSTRQLRELSSERRNLESVASRGPTARRETPPGLAGREQPGRLEREAVGGRTGRGDVGSRNGPATNRTRVSADAGALADAARSRGVSRSNEARSNQPGTLRLPEIERMRSSLGNANRAAVAGGSVGGTPPQPFVTRSAIGDLQRSLLQQQSAGRSGSRAALDASGDSASRSRGNRSSGALNGGTAGAGQVGRSRDNRTGGATGGIRNNAAGASNSAANSYAQQRLRALQQTLGNAQQGLPTTSARGSTSGGSRGSLSRDQRSGLGATGTPNPLTSRGTSSGAGLPRSSSSSSSSSTMSQAQRALQRMQQTDPSFSRQLDRFRSALPSGVAPPSSGSSGRGSATSPFSRNTTPSSSGSASARRALPSNTSPLGRSSSAAGGLTPFQTAPRSFSAGNASRLGPSSSPRSGASSFRSSGGRVSSGLPPSGASSRGFGGGGAPSFRSPSPGFGGGGGSRAFGGGGGGSRAFGGGGSSAPRPGSSGFGGGGRAGSRASGGGGRGAGR